MDTTISVKLIIPSETYQNQGFLTKVEFFLSKTLDKSDFVQYTQKHNKFLLSFE